MSSQQDATGSTTKAATVGRVGLLAPGRSGEVRGSEVEGPGPVAPGGR